MSDNIDILFIAETKLDSTFTTAQFLIDGFQKPIRFDRNGQGGGLMIYIRDRLPAKELSDVDERLGYSLFFDLNLDSRGFFLS